MIPIVDLSNVHGVLFAGSPRGYVDAAIIAVVTVGAVLPAVASTAEDVRDSVRKGARSWLRRGIVLGELVATLALLNVSRNLLSETVCVTIDGHGSARVLAVRVSAPTGCVML